MVGSPDPDDVWSSADQETGLVKAGALNKFMDPGSLEGPRSEVATTYEHVYANTQAHSRTSATAQMRIHTQTHKTHTQTNAHTHIHKHTHVYTLPITHWGIDEVFYS